VSIAVRPALLGQNDGTNGDPISTATGEVYDFLDSDLDVRGPMRLRFNRYYSSSLSTTGLVNSSLGTNWMHNYELRLDLNGNAATVVYEFGQPVNFTFSGGTWNLTTRDSMIYQLVQSGSSFRFFDPSSNIIYTFNTGAGGRLEKIEDRYGSALTLTYTGSLLSRVADGLGRTIDFNYSSGHLASVQDHAGRTVSFTYAGNNLTSAIDALGKTTLYSYTAVGPRTGLLVSSTRPRGNTPYTQAFDANARVMSQTDAAGNTTSFGYNVPSPGSTTLTDPLSHTRVFRHQNVRNLVELKDEAGNSITMGYDGQNRKTSVTDRNGKTTSYSFHAASGLLGSITYPDGSTLTCTYISTTINGFTFYDLTKAVFPDGTDERFTYDASGNVASKTDRKGQTWQFSYNSRGQVLSANMPTGGVVTLTYNSDGTLASYQPPNVGPVTYAYDALKRPISRTQGNGSSRSWIWDARSRIVSFTDERGATVSATYDNNNQLATLTNPAGGTVTFNYTGTERIAKVTDPLGQIVTLTYDALDRLKTTTYPDGAVITYTYDVTGFLSSITDGEGKVWQITHDKEGRETSLITPLGRKTDLSRNALGQISGVTTPLGNQFGLTHDGFGRLATVVDPLLNTTRLNYDARGDISAFTLANGLVANYTRNSLQKITQITDPKGNKWNYAFDAAGRLVSSTDPLGNTMTYTRDSRGRISLVGLPGGGSITTTLDGSGRLTHSSFSDGTALDYSYDSRALLTSATGIALQRDARGDITSSNGVGVERESLGRISKVTFAAGKSVTYSYDKRDLLTSVQDFVGGVTSFTYDADGRLTSIVRPNGTNTNHSYDAEGNSTAINENSGVGPLATTALVRDKNGQVTQATRNVPLNPTGQQMQGLGGSRTFDAASQITGFTYDALGRRTSDSRRTYSWNLASRLQSYTAGVEASQFTYDAFRLMLSQTSGGVARQFVWNYAFDLPSISVVRQGNVDQRYYVHTPEGELLYSIEAADNSRHFYHFDEMGNTLFLTNDAGQITDSYAYAPYGTLLASLGTTDNPFTFAGRYGVMRVGASGLYYIRQRFYDSLNASFISRDSLARIEPRMINPYQYAAENPLLFFDATGGEPNSTAATVGGTSLDVANDIGGAAGSVEYAASAKAARLKETLEMVDFSGANAKTQTAGIKQAKEITKLNKIAKPLKTLGKIGTAAQVVEVGINGYKHYTADEKVMQEAEDERTRILWTYGMQAQNILELYRQKKIGEVERNRLLLQARFEMEDAMLIAGFEEDFGIFLNMTVAFKNGAGTFVPLPLSSIPNPFENKPLIDFGAGEFLLNQ
jgi:RHS repeat-associated protein